MRPALTWRTQMPSSFRQFQLPSLVVGLLAGLLFVSGLPGSFVFDDIPNIVDNKSIQIEQLDVATLARVAAEPQISGSMRVLPTLTFALDYWRAGGMEPTAFKVTNILIHAFTACALAWLFRSLLLAAGLPASRASWLAPALALAWAAHPLQVSSVLYIVQRMQTLGTLFLVLAIWSYLTARRSQIIGRRGRTSFLIALLLWLIAMGCKEDSVLLPAYAFAIELTVLRFAAKDIRLSERLRRGYLIAVLAGVAAFVLLIVPHYWQWTAYPGRDFTTWERLLTQARVLCLYMWQIVLPLPQHMPFYYDWLQPSRSLLHPWTTLPAIALILALLGLAWRQRMRWPLFSLGIFIFFGAHALTSNVVGFELAFEHRNHFALIGAVLTLGSLLAYAMQRVKLRIATQVVLYSALLTILGSATMLRARSWESAVSLARAATEHAPGSGRAWISLCAGYLEAGGGALVDNPLLDDAIEACSQGVAAVPTSLNNAALLLVLKTLRGDVNQHDWAVFQRRLQTVPMTFDNRRAPIILTYHRQKGVGLDKNELLNAIATLVKRAPVKPSEMASLGYFVMNDLSEPAIAVPYFIRAIEGAPANDPFAQQLAAELRAKGQPELAATIQKVGGARRKMSLPAASGDR